nr:hypothetical protein Q903MT_gene1298 [Picea sitchensis]
MSTWVGLVYKFCFVSICGKEELERLKERSSVLSKLGGWFQGPGNPARNQGSNRKVCILKPRNRGHFRVTSLG